jgi:DNA-binding LacI/PurR family transcriptional regulator
MDLPLAKHSPPTVSQKLTGRDLICAELKHYIRAHRIHPGEMLPPLRALSEHFKSSRDIVWRALRQLQEEGWIQARSSRGYEVSEGVYSRILQSLQVKVLLTGTNFINFTGYRRLADALARECRYHNMELVIELLPLDGKPDKSIWKGCDVLLAGSNASSSLLRHCKEFKVPVIGLDAEYSDRYHINVVTDHYTGGRLVAERLLKRNSSRACVVHFENPHARIRARIEGFKQVWLEAGKAEESLTQHIVQWSPNNFDIALNVREDFRSFDGKCDLFVTDGNLALTCLDVFSHLGFSVPGDFKLIGYDGAQLGELTNPPMTTIQQNMEQIAAVAVARMNDCFKPHPGTAEVVRIPPTLVERVSG